MTRVERAEEVEQDTRPSHRHSALALTTHGSFGYISPVKWLRSFRSIQEAAHERQGFSNRCNTFSDANMF